MSGSAQPSDNLVKKVSPVDVSTLQERVYQNIRATLLKGGFEPGEALSIRNLAKACGTSPMPVREALKRLVAAKALVQTPDRLIRVAPYNRTIHDEHIRIRMEIEGYAAERACMRNSPRLLAKLQELNQAMLDASRAHDIDKALAANQAFHFALYEASGYPQLVDIISDLWLRSGPFVATARSASQKTAQEIFETGFKVHNRVIDGIRTGNRTKARYGISLDIRCAYYWLEKNYSFEEL